MAEALPDNRPGVLERLARLESNLEWTKIVLGLLSAVVIGGFSFLGVQISRLDGKVDALSARMSTEIGRLDGKVDALGARLDGKIDALNARIAAEGAQTRQELVGIATAIANSITAARQFQPQILPLPALGPKESGPSQPPIKP